MHELSVTRGMLDVTLEAAAGAKAARVTAIDLVIGTLTSFVDDSVQFYFDILSKDTLAAGAQLRFRRQPALGRCADCGGDWEVIPPIAPVCPLCGSTGLSVSGGTEFMVESIEVD
jgi:hydrogenase nickel incorporation protein HypA/HybF